MTEREARLSRQEDSGVRTALVLGPILTCVGIAWTFIAPSNLSSTAVLVGFATAVWGTHKFGRQGLDRGPEDDDPKGEAPATDAP